MSMPAYKTPLSWLPDATHVNNPDGGDYVAWQIGVSMAANKAIWIIYQVADDPEPLVNILPAGTEYTELEDDLLKYGFDRLLFKNATILQLETELQAMVAEASTLTGAPEDPQWGLPDFT